jgi:hypothetical protein
MTTPAWVRYCKVVYGAGVPSISPGLLSFFYVDLLPPSLRPSSIELLGLVPSSNESLLRPGDALVEVVIPRGARGRYSGRAPGEAYTLFPNGYARQSVAWVYHWGEPEQSAASTRAVSSVGDGQLVEVFHCHEDLDDYWMYKAVGSGIYYNVGRTVVARNALVLASDLNVTAQLEMSTRRFPRCWRARRAPGFACATARERMHYAYLLRQLAFRLLVSRGFDSVQLTHTEEHGIFKHEIIDLRQHDFNLECLDRHRGRQAGRLCHPRREVSEDGTTWQPTSTPCPRKDASTHFHAGWGGIRPCHCDPRASSRCLNCATV